MAEDEYWAALEAEAASATGLSKTARDVIERRYRAAIALTRAHGFSCQPVGQLAQAAEIDEILDRVKTLQSVGASLASPPKARDTEALLGGLEAPGDPTTASEAFEIFVEKIAFKDTYNKSPAQKKAREKTKRTSLNYFLEVMGDPAMVEVTCEQALEYCEWWRQRMAPQDPDEKPVTPNTANRHIGNIRSLFTRYLKCKGDADRPNPFRDTYLEGQSESKRAASKDDFVRSHILLPGVFDDLRLELRVMIFMLIETGARIRGICNLRAEDIRLNDRVPHIAIKPEQKKEIKASASRREIPLVGVALMAAQACPDGFPHYYDRSTLVSANLMKAFRSRKLFPTENHVIYSFRHAFEDRMLEGGLDYGLRCTLMGHKNDRPEYGHGGSLEHRRDELMKIADPFDPAIFQTNEEPGDGVSIGEAGARVPGASLSAPLRRLARFQRAQRGASTSRHGVQ